MGKARSIGTPLRDPAMGLADFGVLPGWESEDCGAGACAWAGAATPALIEAAAIPTVKVLRIFMGRIPFWRIRAGKAKRIQVKTQPMGKQVS